MKFLKFTINKIKKNITKYGLVDASMLGVIKLLKFISNKVNYIIFIIHCKMKGVICLGESDITGRIIISRFPGSTIKIGKGLVSISDSYHYGLNIHPQSIIKTLSQSSIVEIGNNVSINSISVLCRSTKIEIGNNSLIGANCYILDSDFHPAWPPFSRDEYAGSAYDKNIKIGNYVWIGLNVTILKGVQIGDNSVVAAGSVVAQSIPANCLAGGVPAEVIKFYN